MLRDIATWLGSCPAGRGRRVSGKFLAAVVVGASLLCPAVARAQAAHEASPEVPSLQQIAAARAKVMSEYAGALALNGAVWGAPLVTMYALRQHDALGPAAKAPPNTIWRMADISTPELAEAAGYVTPNVNTLYGFGFLDLAAEPVILTVPDSHGRYYMVEIVDLWTNAFAYAGGVATGYAGGRFALVGPGWHGQLPPDVKRIDAPTRWVLIQPRVHVRDREDLPAARAVLAAITVAGLAEATGGKAPPPPAYHYIAPALADPKLPVSALDFTDPLQFWEILAAAMAENPPPADQLSALVPLLKPLGIVPGQAWDRTKLSPAILEAMTKVAAGIGKTLALLPGGSYRNGWLVPAPTIGDFGTDYLTRASVARNGLTANTPREAIYIGALASGDGQTLSGGRRYAMTFTALPPVHEPGFWSLTVYDATNNYPAANPLHRYALGSDDKGLARNSDGSLTLYLQTDSPGKDKEANWLPTPAGQFYLILRAYAPGEALLRLQTDPGAFPLPAIAALE